MLKRRIMQCLMSAHHWFRVNRPHDNCLEQTLHNVFHSVAFDLLSTAWSSINLCPAEQVASGFAQLLQIFHLHTLQSITSSPRLKSSLWSLSFISSVMCAV